MGDVNRLKAEHFML